MSEDVFQYGRSGREYESQLFQPVFGREVGRTLWSI